MPANVVPAEKQIALGNPSKRPIPEAAYELAPLTRTEPMRPLAQAGRQMWDEMVMDCPWLANSDAQLLLQTCELMDERMALRLRILQGLGTWRDRGGLRAIDSQIARNLRELGATPSERTRLALGRVEIAKGLRKLVRDSEDSGFALTKDIVIEAVAAS